MINRFLKHKHMRMSFEEYFMLQRGELTLENIYFKHKFERFDMHSMLNNVNVRKLVIVSLAIALVFIQYKYNTVDVSCAGTGIDKLDSIGYTLLSYAQKFGKWTFLVLGIVNVIKDGMEGASKDAVIRTIVKYLIMFSSLFALPWLFELIESF